MSVYQFFLMPSIPTITVFKGIQDDELPRIQLTVKGDKINMI